MQNNLFVFGFGYKIQYRYVVQTKLWDVAGEQTRPMHYSLGPFSNSCESNEHVSYVTKVQWLHTVKLRSSIITLNVLPNKLQTNVKYKCSLIYIEFHGDALLILSTPLRQNLKMMVSTFKIVHPYWTLTYWIVKTNHCNMTATAILSSQDQVK